MGSSLKLDSSYPNIISREEKLEYIGDRLSNQELNAFMNLANEIKIFGFDKKEEIDEFFGMIQHLLVAYHRVNREIKWTYCPLSDDEQDQDLNQN